MLSGLFHLATVPLKASFTLAFALADLACGGIINHLVIVHLCLPLLPVFFTYPIAAYAPYSTDVLNCCSCQVVCHLIPSLC